MTEPPFVLKPKRHSLLPHSPTRLRERTDDILVHLTPSTAVDALSSTGALWWCLEGVTASERDFAMRTAVASLRIWEWLDELSDWEWPLEGGSAGFENPTSRGVSRRLSFQLAKAAYDGGGNFIGSLPASLVATYERRVDEIAKDMEDLELEEIKNSIITHHIIPLSRPSTPVSASGHLMAGLEYTKMEDLSAVVTAIVIQTLPNLAKLSQLLRTWSIRLTVLQRVPPLLLAIEDAEVGLRAGWNAVSKPVRQSVQLDSNGVVMQRPKLKRSDFDVMRQVLVKKVSDPGRHVDFMLDCLEGMDDTLPERWLDRLEDIERQYADWVAVCERKVRESEWSKPSGNEVSIQETESLNEASVADSERDQSEYFDNVQDESALQEEVPEINRTMSPVDEEDEEDESELPALRSSVRRTSDASGALDDRGDSSRFDLLSSDLPDASASPPVPRDRVRQAEAVDESPPSSPLAGDKHTNGATSQLLESPVIISNLDEGRDETSFVDDFEDSISVSEVTGPRFRRESTGDMQLRQQISEIIESIPAKIKLSAESSINLNPPDLQLPRLKKKPSREGPVKRSTSGMSSRTVTPSFTLAPARNVRPRSQRGQQEIKVYYLSRSTGKPPIKLFIRCVGENGERVMVRVGGGWADLGEYLKEYATHHGRRSTRGDKNNKVEARTVSTTAAAEEAASSPASRSASAAVTSGGTDAASPVTPLSVRKTRGSIGAASNDSSVRMQPNTPANTSLQLDVAIAPSSGESTRSRPSSRLSWAEDDNSFLGLAGPTGKKVEMSEESKAWVESVKEKVRQASGSERKSSGTEEGSSFGELGKVGGTTRVFRKPNVKRRPD